MAEESYAAKVAKMLRGSTKSSQPKAEGSTTKKKDPSIAERINFGGKYPEKKKKK